ncbi:hypothetical protein MP638_001252 [Amoeboaphelidium occidentale]|nr:hypothetical protein MP638_001252 [Amoeboaphelidium occidentale]
MIGYGMAKAAVLQLTKSLMSEGSGMPQGAKVVCLLPTTLDTEANRNAMPKADFSSWTPLHAVADKIVDWSTGNCESGLYEVETKQGQTAFNLRK